MKRPLMAFMLGLLISATVVYFITSDRNSADQAANVPASLRVVELVYLTYGEGDLEPLNITAEIVATSDITIFPEAQGVIQRVHIDENDKVKRNALLFELENTEERLTLARAQAAYNSEQAALEELLREAGSGEDSTTAEIEEQQATLVKNAERSFLNNDVRAYSSGGSYDRSEISDELGPTITGTYRGTEEGSYFIETYGSGAASGISFRASGLETDTQSVTFTQATPLGTRGLQIQFPEIGATKLQYEVWEVPIPNTRSSSYFAALNAYEATLEGADVTLSQIDVNPEVVERQRLAVESARLAVDSARLALSRTIVRSPISGTVTSFDLGVGDFVGAGSPSVVIKSLDDLEGVAYVTEFDRILIEPNASVRIDDRIDGTVTRIGSAIDVTTQKVELRIGSSDPNASRFKSLYTEGQVIDVSIARAAPKDLVEAGAFGTARVVPLTAIQIIGTAPNVFSIDEESRATQHAVTVGLLLGDSIVVTSGIETLDFVIADARGLEDGVPVKTE